MPCELHTHPREGPCRPTSISASALQRFLNPVMRTSRSRMLWRIYRSVSADEHVEGLPHSAWEILEHMRIAQWDILEFSRNARHVSPAWPVGYWPKHSAPPDRKAWQASIEKFREDLRAMQDLIRDPSRDLTTPFRHGSGQDLLREALLVADHNAYHIGQLVLLRRALGAWKH